MTEDMDKELEDLAGDLDADAGIGLDDGDLDLGDVGDTTGDPAGDTGDMDLGDLDLGGAEDAPAAAGEDAADDAGGDLGLGEPGEDDPAEADSGTEESTEEDGEGGEGFDLDDELQSMLGEGDAGESAGEGGGGEAAPMESPPSPDTAMAKAPEGAQLPELSEGQTVNLEFLLDIKLHVTFEVGRSKMLISDLLTLGQGSVIELHRLVGDELDLLINGRLVAKGEVVVVNEKFGCKITEIIPPQERVRYMGVL